VPIERIRVGKGFTKRPSPDVEEWERRYIEVEAVLTEGEVPDKVYDYLVKMIDEWLELIPAKEVKTIPKIDVESLPWVSYRTKQPAKPGEAGWIFTTTEGAEALVRLIQEGKGRVKLGAYEFRFSGNENQFISRRPKAK